MNDSQQIFSIFLIIKTTLWPCGGVSALKLERARVQIYDRVLSSPPWGRGELQTPRMEQVMGG